MKYRRLYREELAELRSDFIQFLSANSVTGKDWEAIKSSHPGKAEELIDIFSDIVWEKVLGRIHYLEFRTANRLQVMHFGDSMARMIDIRIKQASFDFRNPSDLADISEGRKSLKSLNPEITKGQKKYQKEREMEIFYLMEKGAQPCDDTLWNSSFIQNLLGKT